LVVGGAVVVSGFVVVVGRDVVDVASGSVAPDLLDDPVPAPAIPAINKTTTTGAAIFAHNGHARTRSSTERDAGAPTAGMTAVSSHCEVETGCVGAADSGGYHLPSEARHQPGSFGSRSSGPRGVSGTTVPFLRRNPDVTATAQAVPSSERNAAATAPSTPGIAESVRRREAGEMDNNYMTPRLATWRRWTDAPLLVLSIGSLPLLLLELDSGELPYSDQMFLTAVNIAVLVAFAVDFVVGIALSTNRLTYVRREWTSLLIVVGQAVAVAGFGPAGSLRVLRAGRVWRAIAVVSRVVAIGGASARKGRAIVRKHAASFALSTAGFTILTAAVGFTLAEDVGEHGRVHSFFDALWWSTSTTTTVGSEIHPITAAGRLIAVVTMVVGISAASIVTAKIAEFLVRSSREDAANAGAAA
jgi:voltage-gated potassium channel